MATQVKLTIKLGQTAAQVTQGAGTTISGSDAMELNIDVDKMNLRQAIVMLEELEKAIIEGLWPRT